MFGRLAAATNVALAGRLGPAAHTRSRCLEPPELIAAIVVERMRRSIAIFWTAARGPFM